MQRTLSSSRPISGLSKLDEQKDNLDVSTYTFELNEDLNFDFDQSSENEIRNESCRIMTTNSSLPNNTDNNDNTKTLHDIAPYNPNKNLLSYKSNLNFADKQDDITDQLAKKVAGLDTKKQSMLLSLINQIEISNPDDSVDLKEAVSNYMDHTSKSDNSSTIPKISTTLSIKNSNVEENIKDIFPGLQK